MFWRVHDTAFQSRYAGYTAKQAECSIQLTPSPCHLKKRHTEGFFEWSSSFPSVSSISVLPVVHQGYKEFKIEGHDGNSPICNVIWAAAAVIQSIPSKKARHRCCNTAQFVKIKLLVLCFGKFYGKTAQFILHPTTYQYRNSS